MFIDCTDKYKGTLVLGFRQDSTNLAYRGIKMPNK